MTRYFSAQECSKLKFDLVIYRDSVDKDISVLHNLATQVYNMELEENRIREEDYEVRPKHVDSVSDIERYISNEIDWVINHIKDVEINIRYYEEKHKIV